MASDLSAQLRYLSLTDKDINIFYQQMEYFRSDVHARTILRMGLN